MVLLALAASAQDYPSPSDTIVGRCERYIYLDWYDDCQTYYADTETDPYSAYFGMVFYSTADYCADSSNELLVKEFRVDSTLKVGGLVALVMSGTNDWGLRGGERVRFLDYKQEEEAMFLYQHDATAQRQRRLVDSVRWGQSVPRLMKLPKNDLTATSADSTKFMYCYAYEAYFDSAVTVDSTFYVAGTSRSNEFDYSRMVYLHKPIVYFDVMGRRGVMECADCIDNQSLLRGIVGAGEEWDDHYRRSLRVGVFLPIKAVDLTVVADDARMGSTDGSGSFGMGKQCAISARPAAGYRFERWNDSVTDNPRMVELTQDTLFVAHFVEDVGIGSPDGGLAFSLTPNPARGHVTVTLGHAEACRMEVYDAAGRLVLQRTVAAGETRLDIAEWAAGHYSVALYADGRKSVKTFVKK